MGPHDPPNVLRVDPSARVLTGAELATYWHRAFLSPEQKLDSTAGARRLVAWRIVREIGRLRGLIRVGESTADATSGHPSPWTEPFQFFPLKGVDPRDPIVAGFSREPFPLLPTACSPALSEDEIERFCEIARTVGLRLLVHETEDGSAAFDLLTDPELASRAWPRPDEIVETESLEQRRVLKLILARTELEVCSSLTQQGYREHEVSGLVALAKSAARMSMVSDPAADKAIMLMRLQEAAERARGEDKVTAEAAILRLMASVQGLLQSGENSGTGKDGVRGMVRDVQGLSPATAHGVLEPPVEPSNEPA